MIGRMDGREPSSWSRRLPLVVLAAVGCAVAGYLSLFQLGLTSSVWDPIFGSGSMRVLQSPVARSFPVPDALLGCLAYAAEIVLGLLGGRARFRTLPLAVIAFGLVSASLAVTAIALLIAQPVLVGTWCSLCVLSALASLVIFLPAMAELRAALAHVGHERVRGQPLIETLFGRSSPPVTSVGSIATVRPPTTAPTRNRTDGSRPRPPARHPWKG
jgi:uncharacterized membrane protein